MKSTSLILLPHGAGDRAIGFGPEIRAFDYVLLAGSKTRDRMLRKALIRSDNHQIIGYPKFDTTRPGKTDRKKLFNNDNLTVLYNPHFDARLSSWYRFGNDVLRFFADRPNLNLIVAPHVMLFKKKVHFSLQSHYLRIRRSIPAMYFDCPNIHVDTGSSSCIDMTYTLNSDVYLGDVSSQVYEFLTTPRPCIFLNSHSADWKGNDDYKHWTLGPALDSLASLESLLMSSPVASHDQYRDLQVQAAKETFDLTTTPSSSRAAQAVFQFLRSNARNLPTPSLDINLPALVPNTEAEGVLT